VAAQEQEDELRNLVPKVFTINPVDAEVLREKLADDLMKVKMQRMAWYVRLYNWLVNSFTE